MQNLREIYIENLKYFPLKEAVYETLHTAIITAILPTGYRIKDSEIAEILKVSRTPVREALKILLKRDLIVTSQNGYSVKEFDIIECNNIINYIIVLRKEAMKILSRIITEEQIEYLESKMLTVEKVCKQREEGKMTQCYTDYQNFYYEIALMTNNKYLYEELELMQEKLMMMHNMYPDSMKNEFAGESYALNHKDIIKALKGKHKIKSADLLVEEYCKRMNVARHMYELRRDWE